MTFTLGGKVNPLKVFIETKRNVSSRWDPFYFRPELVALEERVSRVTSHRLGDFASSVAGGATPSTRESDTHYTEGEDGVPFIRVQNLSTSGYLNLADVKRITRSTHEKLLKRSQITGGELLVKITGVGRMAVSSVVPEGFEGNINQHIVVIRTNDIGTSEALAAYLNLDLAERLASRRTTGGTRPALDYPSLLSIPVIMDERIVATMRTAIEKKQAQIERARALVNGIDDILLTGLGIARQQECRTDLEHRIFQRRFAAVVGRRIDPAANWKRLTFTGGRFPLRRLTEVADINPLTRLSRLHSRIMVSFVPMEAVSDLFGEIVDHKMRPLGEAKGYTLFQNEDVIWAKITPCMENGKSALAERLSEGVGFGSTEFHVFRRKTNELNPRFLHYLLRLRIVRQHARLNFTGSSGHQRVDEQFFRRMEIPFPPSKVQNEIAENAEAARTEARTLLAKANAEFQETKRGIEELILKG